MVREKAFDEVFDSQAAFRILLDSMSRPGRLYTLAALPFTGTPTGLNPHVLTVLRTLCDNMVTFCVVTKGSDAPRDSEHVRYLQINTGARSASRYHADYVVLDGRRAAAALRDLKRGSPEFPEDSATAVVAVEELLGPGDGENGDEARFSLTGPGIKNRAEARVCGLEAGCLETLREINGDFPLGIDVILVDGEGRVASIPRSSSIRIED